MSRKTLWHFALLTLIVAILVTACGPKATPEPEEFVFGMIMVGPYNDHGWSEAHYEAGRYVEEHVAGARMIYLDKMNPADRPETTVEQQVDHPHYFRRFPGRHRSRRPEVSRCHLHQHLRRPRPGRRRPQKPG
jgi:hypothetical protein